MTRPPAIEPRGPAAQRRGLSVCGPEGAAVRVAYCDEPTVGLRVNRIRTWARDEVAEPVMSASSGPKPYMRNYIWAAFQTDPGIARVHLVRGEYRQSVPFLLVEDAAGHVFDMTSREVAVQR